MSIDIDFVLTPSVSPNCQGFVTWKQPQQHLPEDERLRSKTLKEQSLWGGQLSERKLVLNSLSVTEKFVKWLVLTHIGKVFEGNLLWGLSVNVSAIKIHRRRSRGRRSHPKQNLGEGGRAPLVLVPKNTFTDKFDNTFDISDFRSAHFLPSDDSRTTYEAQWSRTAWTTTYWCIATNWWRTH